MIKRVLVQTAILFSALSCGHNLPDFTARLSTRLPFEAKAEAIGEYALGCLKGAQTFTGQEEGLVLSQMKRGRYWGHPDLINLLSGAGAEFHKKGKSLIVGDLSQSRGGPTMTGHNSHQNGLDVDIWFKMLTGKEQLSFRETETEEMKVFIELGKDQIELIQFFAEDSRVERIFINPLFKRKLCQDSGALKLGFESQRKLRAWWGHDDHIHVRLKCPIDSPSCVDQKSIPSGDGCGDELNWWFSDEAKAASVDASWEELKSLYLDKIKKLPAQCSFYQTTF